MRGYYNIMIEEKARVLRNEQLMPDTFLLELEAPQSAHQAQPGQFAMIKVSASNSCMLRRPLSIHRAEGNNLFFLYSIIGKGTKFLSQQTKGQTLSILAPLGNGFHLPDDKTGILLLAGGIGIAPLIFLAEKALEKGIRPKLLIGARAAECLYPSAHLPRGMDIDLATEDGSIGFKGRITELFLSQIQRKSRIYACGPTDMYVEISKSLEKLLDFSNRVSSGQIENLPNITSAKQIRVTSGALKEIKYFSKIVHILKNISEVQVSLEARMACGVGACYGCVIKTKTGPKKVCSDGPVFNLEEIQWEEVRI